MANTVEKKTRGRQKGTEEGMNTGGSYVGASNISLARSILTLQSGTGPSREQIEEWLKALLVLRREEQVTAVLFPHLFRAAALQAFPDQGQRIAQLHTFALAIAELRRGQKVLRPQQDVRDHLLGDEIPQLIAALQEKTQTSEAQKRQRRRVRSRLASVLYYCVQMLVLDLEQAIAQAQQEKEMFAATLEKKSSQAIANFQQQVDTYCTLANVPLPVAFQKAVLKFGLRSLDGAKYEAAEELLMDDESEEQIL